MGKGVVPEFSVSSYVVVCAACLGPLVLWLCGEGSVFHDSSYNKIMQLASVWEGRHHWSPNFSASSHFHRLSGW